MTVTMNLRLRSRPSSGPSTGGMVDGWFKGCALLSVVVVEYSNSLYRQHMARAVDLRSSALGAYDGHSHTPQYPSRVSIPSPAPSTQYVGRSAGVGRHVTRCDAPPRTMWWRMCSTKQAAPPRPSS